MDSDHSVSTLGKGLPFLSEHSVVHLSNEIVTNDIVSFTFKRIPIIGIFFPHKVPEPSVLSHSWPRLFFSFKFQICLELTKPKTSGNHLDFNSRRKAHLKAFLMPLDHNEIKLKNSFNELSANELEACGLNFS